jgi:hypothetical protein
MKNLEPPPDHALLDNLLDLIRARAQRDPGDEKVRTDPSRPRIDLRVPGPGPTLHAGICQGRGDLQRRNALLDELRALARTNPDHEILRKALAAACSKT